MNFRTLVLIQIGALVISGLCLCCQFTHWEWEIEVLSEFTFILYWFIGGLTLIIPNGLLLDIFEVNTNKWLRISVSIASVLAGFTLFSILFFYFWVIIYPAICLYSIIVIAVYRF